MEEKIDDPSENIQRQQKEPSKCNQFINRFMKFPEMTIEKIIRAVILIGGTVFMIISCFTGAAYSRYNVDCLDDMSHIYTSSINDFFYDAKIFNLILKFIISLLIDLIIIYTLIIWSLYSSNIRLLSSGISYMIINYLVRFLHIQKQPKKSAYTVNHIFSIFVNYQITTYSFYSIIIGILVICAYEWRRNDNYIMFWIILGLLFIESIILIVMQGNYFHEIFTAFVFGHYLFIINENILIWIYGEKYLSTDNDIDDLTIRMNSSNANTDISERNTNDNEKNNNDNEKNNNDDGNKEKETSED
jgi:hypothetical protein